jgi:hypothetical protein
MKNTKLFLYKRSFYSDIYIFFENKKKYILKTRKLGIDKEYKNLIFLKKKNFPFIPETSIKRIGKNKFLMQPFIRSSKFTYDSKSISLLAKALGTLHSIKEEKPKNISLFSKRKIKLLEETLENCFFLLQEIKKEDYLKKYLLLKKYIFF